MAEPKFGQYVKPAKPPAKRAIITGFCANTRHMVPYNEPDVCVFGLNAGRIFMPRADYWFETHGPNIWQWAIRRPDKHIEWLKAFPGPIFMHEAHPDIPNSITYPLAEVAADVMPGNVYRWLMQDGAGSPGKLNPDGSRVLEPQRENPYLTSSIAFQIALAIYERFEQIEIYGVDLNTGGEYAWQKPGVEYLLGIAAQRGITVVIPDDAALLKGKLYGRGFKTKEGDKITKSQYEVRLEEIRRQREATAQQYFQLRGAYSELQRILDQDMPPGLNYEKLHDRWKAMKLELEKVEAAANQLVGEEKEIMYWISFTPEGQSGKEALEQLKSENGNGQAAQYDVLAAETYA